VIGGVISPFFNRVLLCLTVAGPLVPSVAAHSGALEQGTPQLANVPEVAVSVDDMLQRSRLTPSARRATYGGAVKPHPLVARAAMILTHELARYAGGVFITSLNRAPEDQKRLMKERRYRYWTINRSKHLMGYAVDIGFYERHHTMTSLHFRAQYVLRKHLGDDDYSRLRVVQEARCLHIELNTKEAREEIKDRTASLLRHGILAQAPEKHIVPSLDDYVPEDEWLRTPRDLLVAHSH